MSDGKSSTTIDLATGRELLSEIEKMAKSLAVLRKKILRALPAKYGSEMWWEKSTKKALKEIEEGKGVEFETAGEATGWLNS